MQHWKIQAVIRFMVFYKMICSPPFHLLSIFTFKNDQAFPGSFFTIDVQEVCMCMFVGSLRGRCACMYQGMQASRQQAKRVIFIDLFFFLKSLLSQWSCTYRWLLKIFAAAKSCQLCPTLCDPIDGSAPGSSVEWVAISLSNA